MSKSEISGQYHPEEGLCKTEKHQLKIKCQLTTSDCWFCFSTFIRNVTNSAIILSILMYYDISLTKVILLIAQYITYMSGVIKFRINQDLLIDHSCILHIRSIFLLL